MWRPRADRRRSVLSRRPSASALRRPRRPRSRRAARRPRPRCRPRRRRAGRGRSSGLVVLRESSPTSGPAGSSGRPGGSSSVGRSSSPNATSSSSGSAAATASCQRSASACSVAEQVGVRHGQPEDGLVGQVERLQPRTAAERALQHEQRRRGLAQVGAGAGLDQPQLDRLVRRRDALGQRLADQPEGHLRPAQRPLAVGQHRAVALVPAHPPVGAQFPRGLGVVAGVVRGDAHGLADGGDARRAVTGGLGVDEEASAGPRRPGSRRRPGARPRAARCVHRGSAARRAPRGPGHAGRPSRGSPGPWAGGGRAPRRRRAGGRPGRRRARGHGSPTDAAPAGHCLRAARRTPGGGRCGGGGRSPCGLRSCHCGRSPVGSPVTAAARSCHCPARRSTGAVTLGRRSCHCGRSPAGRSPAGGGPAPWPSPAGRSPCGCGPATADDPRWAPVGPGNAARRSAAPGAVGPATADDHRWGVDGNHRRTAAARGRSPWGRRSCHWGRSPLGRSPWGRRSCQCGRGRGAARPVTLRAPVLPLRTIAGVGRSPAGAGRTLRTIAAERPVRARSCPCGRPPRRAATLQDGRSCHSRAVSGTGGHPAAAGPATVGRSPAGRSPCGRRSCPPCFSSREEPAPRPVAGRPPDAPPAPRG